MDPFLGRACITRRCACCAQTIKDNSILGPVLDITVPDLSTATVPQLLQAYQTQQHQTHHQALCWNQRCATAQQHTYQRCRPSQDSVHTTYTITAHPDILLLNICPSATAGLPCTGDLLLRGTQLGTKTYSLISYTVQEQVQGPYWRTTTYIRRLHPPGWIRCHPDPDSNIPTPAQPDPIHVPLGRGALLHFESTATIAPLQSPPAPVILPTQSTSLPGVLTTIRTLLASPIFNAALLATRADPTAEQLDPKKHRTLDKEDGMVRQP